MLVACLYIRWPGPTLRGPGQLVLLIADSSSCCFRITVEELLVRGHHSATHRSAIQVQLEGPVAGIILPPVYTDSCQGIAVSLRAADFDVHRNAVPAAKALRCLVIVSRYVDPDWI